MTVWRLLKPPKPRGVASVSPQVTPIHEGSPPSCSATICASMVCVLWPMAVAPLATATLPEGLMRTVTVS